MLQLGHSGRVRFLAWCTVLGLFRHASAPKTAIKRVFLVTDQDDPHPEDSGLQLVTSARTTLVVGASP